jgi:hypothetical protein
VSQIKAAAYYAGIPAKNSNPEKPLILDYFCQGVTASGDIAIPHKGFTTVDCDVALIQGFVHDEGKTLPHLQLRKDAINLQKQKGKRSLIVDSNLFLYVNKKNPLHYLRYSFDGVFPTTGFYFDKDVQSERWSKISKDLNISLKPWRESGNHILICLQRNGGWSMGGVNVVQWMMQTIQTIKQYSDRPIVIRSHPGDKKTQQALSVRQKNVTISNKDSLVEDLTGAWATIVYNSSPSVASLIEGVPAFITDPNPEQSQSYGMANTDISMIENPILLDRQQWVEKLAMSHWNFDELRSGKAWQFFRQYI